MRVLVTGATGFVGRALIPCLCQRAGTEVWVMVRQRENGAGIDLRSRVRFPAEIGIVYADLRDLELTMRAVEQAQPDCVIHLATAGATNPFLDIQDALNHNLTGTINLLRACFEKSESCGRLLLARSPGELTAMNVYAASKAAVWKFCEMYVRTRQWPVQGTMIFQAYGPGQSERALIPSALAAAAAGHDFPMTGGRQRRDWIYISDVVAGIIASLEADLSPGATVELGTGLQTSVAEVVRQIYALAGNGGGPLIGQLQSRPGEALAQVADVQRTRLMTGWASQIDLTTGLATLASPSTR